MSAKPQIETWHAIFRKTSPDGREICLVALLRDEEDANAWHDNPQVYFNARRRVKLSPAPIEIYEAPASDFALAVEIIEQLACNPAEEISGKMIERAQAFVRRIKAERRKQA